jgi:hypothetical protein
MERRQFRFKTDYYLINGIYNIPGFVICPGHGHDFETYCCKKCGELYVLDLELLHHTKTELQTLCADKACPKCKDNLQTCLVNYPENIFYNGAILINTNPINRQEFDKTVEREVYVLN